VTTPTGANASGQNPVADRHAHPGGGRCRLAAVLWERGVQAVPWRSPRRSPSVLIEARANSGGTRRPETFDVALDMAGTPFREGVAGAVHHPVGRPGSTARSRQIGHPMPCVRSARRMDAIRFRSSRRVTGYRRFGCVDRFYRRTRRQGPAARAEGVHLPVAAGDGKGVG
jgi:hypothetical protein